MLGVHIRAVRGWISPLDQLVAHWANACGSSGIAAIVCMYELRHPDGPGPAFGRSWAACLVAMLGLILQRFPFGIARAALKLALRRAASSPVSCVVLKRSRTCLFTSCDGGTGGLPARMLVALRRPPTRARDAARSRVASGMAGAESSCVGLIKEWAGAVRLGGAASSSAMSSQRS